MMPPLIRTGGWCLLAGAAPAAVPSLARVLAGADPAWWQASALSREALAGITLACDTAWLMVACALAAPVGRTAASAAAFLGGSAFVVSLVAGPATAGTWVQAHAVMTLAAIAGLSVRRLASQHLTAPLDAAGASLALTVSALAALLAIGPALPTAPDWVVAVVLRANPVIAVTAAAGIDPLRTDLLYRLSPVAHWNFVYPGATASMLTFGVVAAACVAGGILRPTSSRTTP